MIRRGGILILLAFVIYLVLPSPDFPAPPPGSLQSSEPADTESTYRRSYFTNLSRKEVLSYYEKQFGKFILLNYPPEEAATLIRDQTRSSWLQEIVHPWRESLYINGFYPTKPTEQINRNDVHYLNKLTIRYVPSHPITRVTTLALCSLCIIWLVKEYARI